MRPEDLTLFHRLKQAGTRADADRRLTPVTYELKEGGVRIVVYAANNLPPMEEHLVPWDEVKFGKKCPLLALHREMRKKYG